MTEELEELFQSRPDSEIVMVTPQQIEEVLKEAESFIHNKFLAKLAVDGGDLARIDSAMARSLFELFVRGQALTTSEGPIPKIDLTTYQDALKKFEEFVNEKFNSYDLLLSYWLLQVKLCVSNVFAISAKVFKTYVLGDICENMYLDNKLAEAVIQRLEEDNFVKVIGKQYNQEILVKVT